MDNWLVKWKGPNKINGVVALRTVFGLGLRETVRIIDNPEGFVCSQLQWIALRGEYMLKAAVVYSKGDLTRDRYINDWLVQEYEQSNPVWLVDNRCRDEMLEDSAHD